MKKPIILSIIMALMLLTLGSLAPTHAQDSAKEEKPTFYHLVPGTYVNGWPRFTMTYPKDWVEMPLIILQLFAAKTPGPTLGAVFSVYHFSSPLPLDKFVDLVVQWFRITTDRDVTVVSDRPSRLRDGTPAQEVELQMVSNGEPYNWLGVATKKGDIWINTNIGLYKGKIGEDLKAVLYSLQYEPNKDEPVKVPSDVQEFLDRNSNDALSHDLTKIMASFSDKFLNSGVRKGEVERGLRQSIGNLMSSKVTITDFVPAGDRAYLTGFRIINNRFTFSLTETSIIKESGEWKWYGNQRDPVP